MYLRELRFDKSLNSTAQIRQYGHSVSMVSKEIHWGSKIITGA